jgi:microcystin-dependent protein
MSEPFIGEIRPFAFNFPPKGWASCNGQLLPINQNQALFALLGTTYGGDGRVNFALPDYRGRAPVGLGLSIVQGEKTGEEAHTLTQAEMPAHTHARASSNQATTASPAGNVLAARPRRGVSRYAPGGASSMLADGTQLEGGSQPHNNMQPYLTIQFAIALQGIFPARD